MVYLKPTVTLTRKLTPLLIACSCVICSFDLGQVMLKLGHVTTGSQRLHYRQCFVTVTGKISFFSRVKDLILNHSFFPLALRFRIGRLLISLHPAISFLSINFLSRVSFSLHYSLMMPLEKKEGLFGGITPLIYYWKKRRELFIEETNNDVRVLFSDSNLSKKKGLIPM